jgi:DNA-binding NtrC family response regulator
MNSKFKILIVEDVGTHRDIITDILKKKGYKFDFVVDPSSKITTEIKLEWVQNKIKEDIEEIGMIILDLTWNSEEDAILSRMETSINPDEIWKDLRIRKTEPQVFKLLEYLDNIDTFIPVLIFSKWTNLGYFMDLLKTGFRAKREIIHKPDSGNEDEWENILSKYIDSYLRAKDTVDTTKEEFVGDSTEWIETLNLARLYADSDAPIIITGDSGIGKSQLARAIHSLSKRSDKKFKGVNIAALSPTLIHSELFGHVKGSFTGAGYDKMGIFEYANGGTVFLDEIGDMPKDQQILLLKALEDKYIEKLGDNKKIDIDVRIICATNCDLSKLISLNQFREDLYYRIHVLPMHLKPLKERKSDIPLLLAHFMKKESLKMGKPNVQINQSDINELVNYNFPGNIRQLRSIVIRSLSTGKSLSESLAYEEDIKKYFNIKSDDYYSNYIEKRFSKMIEFNESINDVLEEISQDFYKIALKKSGTYSKAAEMLKLDKSTFRYRVKSKNHLGRSKDD